MEEKVVVADGEGVVSFFRAWKYAGVVISKSPVLELKRELGRGRVRGHRRIYPKGKMAPFHLEGDTRS